MLVTLVVISVVSMAFILGHTVWSLFGDDQPPLGEAVATTQPARTHA